jgi:uncharacterized protein
MKHSSWNYKILGEQSISKSRHKLIDTILKSFEKRMNKGEFTTITDVHNFLVDSSKLEDKDAKFIISLIIGRFHQKIIPPITKLELFLTENCNLRCEYCFVKGKNRYNKMTEKIGKKAIDLLFKESKEEKDLEILFFGGEPLLELKLIKIITEYSEEMARQFDKSVAFSMTTNGILFSDDSLNYCRKHKIIFLLSVDGNRETHDRFRKIPSGKGSFDLIESKISTLKKYQPWLGARVTVHPDNVEKLMDNIEFLFSRGFNQFIIGPTTGVAWSQEKVDIYENQMLKLAEYYKILINENKPIRITSFEKSLEDSSGVLGIWGCQAGRNSVVISTNGDIYPCSKMLGVSGHKGFYKLGNVQTGITNKEKRKELIEYRPKTIRKCYKCQYIDYCYGGCYAVNYEETNNIFIPSGLECEFLKTSLKITKKIGKIESSI